MTCISKKKNVKYKQICFIFYTKDNIKNLKQCLTTFRKMLGKTNSMCSKIEKFHFIGKIIIIDNSSEINRKILIDEVHKYFASYMPWQEKGYIILLNKQIEYVKAINICLRSIYKKTINSPTYITLIDSNLKFNITNTIIKDLIEELELNKDISVVSVKNNDEINLKLCMFRFNFENTPQILLDENVISSENAGNILAKKFSSTKINNEIIFENTISNDLADITMKYWNIKNSFNNKPPYILYTFVGKSDSLCNITNFDSKFEYVCFHNGADNLQFNSNWKIIDVSDIQKTMNLSEIQLKEYIKLHPHYFFENKNISIWIDSNIIDDILINDYTEIICKMNKDVFLLCPESMIDNCSYTFLEKLLNNKIINSQEYNSIFQLYKSNHLQLESGMIDSTILIRKHNDIKCKEIMEQVWNYDKNVKCKTELFLNFMLMIHKYNYSYIPNKILFSKYFKLKDS